MGLSVVVDPGFEPVSLDEAKSHCRITNTVEDGLIAGYILAARQMIEASTRRVLVQQTFDFTIDWRWPFRSRTVDGYCFANQRIELPVSPVLSSSDVVSVTYVDWNGAVQTLDPAQYQIALSGPVPVIDPVYGIYWPTTRWQAEAITVRFKAGYGTSPGDTPEPLRQAMLLLIGHWYAVRETVNVGNITSELPWTTEALLSPFRQSRILS